MSFLDNFKKPAGFFGKVVLSRMNIEHIQISRWGFSHLDGKVIGHGLDIGCGGGANLKNLLHHGCSSVIGMDYSEISVKKSSKVNRKSIVKGKCSVVQADVLSIPFEDGKFDIVTAFDTIYFWREIKTSFLNVYRVLKSGGTFFICNGFDGLHEKDMEWSKTAMSGMTIYTPKELQDFLSEAGFKDIKIDSVFNKSYLCITAQK